MRYRNSEMKIDHLVTYLNDEKINLSPVFQRGHVWKPKSRRKLVSNIVLGLPIPAIFLYKEPVGSKYTYNILDGKQRLESLILFIMDTRPDIRIPNWWRYFHGYHRERKPLTIDLSEGKRTFAQLTDHVIRDFREYIIPTIEISLEDNNSLDEVITLFVDINQQGEPVTRFHIVKAMCKSDPLLKDVFSLIAQEQRRGQDVFYKAKKTIVTDVLKLLQVVGNIAVPNAKVDKMWEKLLELALFARTGEHRKPVAILKEFITLNKDKRPKLNEKEMTRLRKVFKVLLSLSSQLPNSRIFTDQTHSYTVITSILSEDLVKSLGEKLLKKKLKKFAALLDKDRAPTRKTQSWLRQYRELSAKQTTDVSRRQERQRLFLLLLRA